LVSLGHVRQSNEFRRALAAATVHDFFNLMAVAILLPFELITGRLSWLASKTADLLVGSGGSEWKSPIKAWVKHPVGWLKDGLGGLGFDDNGLGISMVVVGLLVVVAALIAITKNMKTLIAARLERSMNRVLARGGGVVAIAVGIMVTIAVHVKYHHIDPHPDVGRWRYQLAQRVSSHSWGQCRDDDHRATRRPRLKRL